LVVSLREAFPGLGLKEAVAAATDGDHLPDTAVDDALEDALAALAAPARSAGSRLSEKQ